VISDLASFTQGFYAIAYSDLSLSAIWIMWHLLADLALINTNIRTMNSLQPLAQAVAYKEKQDFQSRDKSRDKPSSW